MKKRYDVFICTFGKIKLNASTNAKSAATRIFNSLINSAKWLPYMEKISLVDNKEKDIIKVWSRI